MAGALWFPDRTGSIKSRRLSVGRHLEHDRNFSPMTCFAFAFSILRKQHTTILIATCVISQCVPVPGPSWVVTRSSSNKGRTKDNVLLDEHAIIQSKVLRALVQRPSLQDGRLFWLAFVFLFIICFYFFSPVLSFRRLF